MALLTTLIPRGAAAQAPAPTHDAPAHYSSARYVEREPVTEAEAGAEAAEAEAGTGAADATAPDLATLTVPPPPDILILPPPLYSRDELHAAEERRGREPSPDYGPATLGAFVGEAAAAILGAGLAMAITATQGLCPPDEDCGDTLALAALAGGLSLTPLGAFAGAVVGGDLAGQRGDVGWTLFGVLAGYAIGALVYPLGLLIGEGDVGGMVMSPVFGLGAAGTLASLGYGGF